MKLDLKKERNRRVIWFDHKTTPGLECIGHYRYTKAAKKLSLHQHEHIIEICYLESGYQKYVVNNQTYRLKGGDIFISFPNEPHGTGEFVEEKGSLYWVQLKLDPKQKHFLNLTSEQKNYLFSHLKNLPQRHFKGSKKWKNLLESYFTSFQLDSIKREIVFIDIGIRTCFLIIEDSNKKFESMKQNEIDLSITYINENIFNKITITTLADKCHLSESHFKAKFKDTTGISPADFIQRKKIEKAKELLISKKFNITEIAHKLQYPSSQHFSFVFKKYMGVTPTQFKKKELI